MINKIPILQVKIGQWFRLGPGYTPAMVVDSLAFKMLLRHTDPAIQTPNGKPLAEQVFAIQKQSNALIVVDNSHQVELLTPEEAAKL